MIFVGRRYRGYHMVEGEEAAIIMGEPCDGHHWEPERRHRQDVEILLTKWCLKKEQLHCLGRQNF